MKRYGVRTCFVIGALCAVTGCALKNYEEQIDKQQKRMAFLDEESRVLNSSSIDLPKVETKDGKRDYWPFDVFLRLPRNFSTQPAIPGYSPDGKDPWLFRYGGSPGYNIFLAAGLLPEDKKADKGKGDKEKEKQKPMEWPAAKFRSLVRLALMDYFRKEYKSNPEFPLFDKFTTVQKLPVTERGVQLPRIEYDAIAFKDDKQAILFYAYFHQWDTRQLAIVMQMPLAVQSDATVNAAMDWSLKTLEIGSAAGSKRSALQSRNSFRL